MFTECQSFLWDKKNIFELLQTTVYNANEWRCRLKNKQCIFFSIWTLFYRSEIHAVMTGGFATIAGTVLGAYINFGTCAE